VTKIAGPCRGQLTAYVWRVSVLDSSFRPHPLRDPSTDERRDGLEWTRHRVKCRTTTTNSARIDTHRGTPEKVFRLQSISGDRPIAKDTQDRAGRLACDQQIHRSAC